MKSVHWLAGIAAIWICLLLQPPAALAQEPILSASEVDYPPFCLVDENGRACGFSVELMQAALAAMDRRVTFRTGPWADVKGWLERGDVQALPLVGRTPEREPFFDFTFPYMTLYGAIVVRTDTRGILELSDLVGKRVAVMKGDNAEEFLRRENRALEIRTTATCDQALRELSEGLHDAVVIQRLVALRLLEQTKLSNLRVINRPVEDFRQDFCFAVKEADRETLALLNEGLALVIADGTYRRLHQKWFAALELPSRRIVIGGDRSCPPYEYLDEKGRPAGFHVDLTRSIAQEVGLDVEIRLGVWSEIRGQFARGEIDAVLDMHSCSERDSKFDFTPAHTVKHYVWVVRRGEGNMPSSPDELRGRRIAAQERDIVREFASKNGLENLVLFESPGQALREVAEGRCDCALVCRRTALCEIERNGWRNLRVGTHGVISADYCYAVPRGHKALLTQLAEGLSAVEHSGEYRRIFDKWMSGYEAPAWRSAVVLKYVAMVALPLILFGLCFFLWSWSLRRQVAAKTRELHRSESLLRIAGRLAHLGGWSVDLAKNRVTWSDEVAAIHEMPAGFSPTVEEGIAFYAPEFREKIAQVFAACAREGIPYEEETQIVTGKGRRVWIRTSGIAERDASGTIVRASGGFQEIDAFKRAQERIEHLNRVLRAIRDVNQLIVREKDRRALLREACRLLVANRGYRFVSMVLVDESGHPVLWEEAGVESTGESRKATLERGELPPCCELARQKEGVVPIRRDGSLCGKCAFAAQLRGTDAACVRILCEGRCYGYLLALMEGALDVDSEEQSLFQEIASDLGFALRGIEMDEGRRALELALRASEARYRQLAETTRDIIALCDAEGKILYMNRAGLEFTGYSEEQALSSSILSFFFPEECSKSARHGILFASDSAETPMCQIDCIDRSGRRVPFEISSAQIREGEKPAARLIVARNIEDRLSLERQLRQAQKMECVGQLASGVAHDYNNMLTVIMGYAELAMKKIEPSHVAIVYLREIHEAARHSAEITRQLLFFARKQVVAPVVLDLNRSVEGMLKILRRMIGENIDLSWIGNASPAWVKIDPAHVDQILANLCVNARDAIGGNGEITVETKNVRIEEKYRAERPPFLSGEFVLLAVRDDGCGMDKATLEKLFEPFFTTKGSNGTGLGLATVYEIVRQNGGFVDVESQPGKGSAFRVHLPLCDEGSPESIEPAAEENLSSHGETLLLVEDDPATLSMMQMALEALGYRVLAASAPWQALAIVHEVPRIDALVSDMILPEMNGFDLAMRLQRIYPEMQILLVSGYSSELVTSQSLLEENLNFLPKPFSTAQLAAKLRKMLEKK